ncbi:MAG TPA: zinc-ribbon domain-containing protein, partial [Anaeromyxobacteraceae bacterium]|nr:zinc-ribbon domain-containing protein [Anaeromyxobacteraceae bacterium]
MDVRCERCRAQYVFDDDQVTPAGLTVQCTNCGHVFKVRKKELVVTVPVKPDEIQGTPLPASAAAPREKAPAAAPAPAGSRPILTPVPGGAAAPEPREWRVRQANGNVFAFRELTTLQKWIIEQKVSRDDEISQGGDNWKRLGNIPDLASFFQVVEAAERAKLQASAPSLTPVPMAPVYPVAFPPPGMYTPVPGYPPSPYPPQGAQPPEPGRPDSRSERPIERRPRRGGGRAWLLGVLLLLVAGGAAVYVLRPDWLGLGAAPEFAVPVTVAAPAGEPQGTPAGGGPAGTVPAGAGQT